MSCHPQTPQSPSQSSPSTSELFSVTVSMSSATTYTLPTPAHSVNGAIAQPHEMTHDAIPSGDSPQKRKRAIDDMGGQAHKKVHLEAAKLSIEDLHLDVGDKYLLCRTPHPHTAPKASDDLFEMFNLTSLAAEVAREKPNGDKNALRKTYKGHIKRLGIMGHFDAVRKEATDPTGLMAMISVPDQEWYIHEVQNRDIQDGLSETTQACVGRAMSMAKGTIPKHVWDSSVLGDLAASGVDVTKQLPSAKPTAPNTPSGAATPAFVARVRLQGNTDLGAQKGPGFDPTRGRKKRSFGDGSFEGYSEGFQDDGSGEAGYSTGEDRGGQKRRKKASSSCSTTAANSANILQNPGKGQSQSGPMRQNGFGPPTVGA